ncbi:MAG TPA: hypothetical protein VG652_07130 [Gaiellaceae bacterium]|nr:hypothetical protein [Gaiellaceae bacterium]
MKRVLAIALLLVFVATGEATAKSPWQLDCASMPVEHATPTALRKTTLAFFPWIRPAAKSLQAGPVYLIALSSHTAISRDGDSTDTSGYYLHRALIAIGPTQTGTVTVTGRRLGTPGPRTTLGFSTTGATSCSVSRRLGVVCGYRPLTFATSLRIAPRAGWRVVATELRIGRTGCFQLTARGPGLNQTIPLEVPGPDYGTTGW